MTTKDAVVLVPGFLGFSRIGTLYYFADRVAASLRGALEIELRRSVPVVPFGSLPAAGLRPRQRALLDSLAALDRTLSGVQRFHLVGHSAGGVDAQLLTSDRPLEGDSWRSADAGLCNRIASVTTI